MLDGVGVMPTPTPTPMPRKRSTPPLPARRYEEDDEPGFFSYILDCFVLPFRGQGISWLLAALGVATVGVIGGLVPFFGWLVQLLMSLGLLALCARFFQSCLASTAAKGDRSSGLPEMSAFFGDFILPGIALSLWFISVYIPLLLWLRSNWDGADLSTLLVAPVTLLLVAVPYILWPMALARAAVTGSFLSMWNIPRILLGIVRAPLRYGFVLLIGFLSALIPVVMLPVLTMGGSSLFVTLFIAVLQVAIMAYSHGVMGSLLGHLARMEPKVIAD